jgi:hypothetical protein
MKRIVVFFDDHLPYTITSYFDVRNPSRHTAIDKFLKDFKPTHLGRGGDMLDLDCISHWNRRKPLIVEGKRLKRDFELCKRMLDKQDAIVEKTAEEKFFLTGNHEQWLEDLVEEDPQGAQGFVELDENVNLRDRGYIVVPRRRMHAIGKLCFIHGDYKDKYIPVYHARAIAGLYHRNVIYGHFHTEQSYTENSPVDMHPVMAQSVGTMGHVNPEWRRNAPNAWVNSFFVAYLDEQTNNFTPYLVRIIRGQFTFAGETYK